MGGGSASDLVGPGSGKVQRLPRLEQDTGGVVVEGVFTRRRRVLADLGGAGGADLVLFQGLGQGVIVQVSELPGWDQQPLLRAREDEMQVVLVVIMQVFHVIVSPDPRCQPVVAGGW